MGVGEKEEGFAGTPQIFPLKQPLKLNSVFASSDPMPLNPYSVLLHYLKIASFSAF